MIKIADKSAGGWDTVKEYESDELASDSEDDKRLKRAESRAMAKRDKARQGRKPVSTPGPNSSGFGGNFTPGFSYDTDSGNVMQPFRGPKRSNRFLQCYACHGWGHTRPNCPSLLSGPGVAYNSVPGAFGIGNQWQPGQFPRQQHQPHPQQQLTDEKSTTK